MWSNPVVRSGELYEILLKRNIPMIIMEPVKGGNLASLKPELEAIYKTLRPDASTASWALRYAASLPGIMTVLSGMSNMDQVRDNLNTFRNFEPLSDAEKGAVAEVTSAMLSTSLIGCTACRYCTDGCPMHISIPDIFRAINTLRLYPNDWRSHNFYKNLLSTSGRASDCIACGQCEGVCPQHLHIIDLLKEASGILDKND